MELSQINLQLELANKLIFVKEYKKAEVLIEELLTSEEFSDDPLVHLRRIELATKLGNLESLLAQYQAEMEKTPDRVLPKVCHTLVQQHGEMISPENAIVQFQSLLKIVGPDPSVYYGLGFSMEMTGNFERALFNYEQCTNLDHSWYPAYFGLSQIFYNLGQDAKGDQYFFMFEEYAPYNVYGNFETHRKLSQEFSQKEEYELSMQAIVTLSEWWIENKGYCPVEIQIYERLASASILEMQGASEEAEQRKNQSSLLVGRALENEEEPVDVLYFIAKTLEEFDEHQMAIDVYKEILSRDLSNPELVQKIGSHFISMGEIEISEEVFHTAYKNHPDHPEIRFCWMVSRLRRFDVNVEEYLIDKERLRTISNQGGDKVELLSLLHSLIARFAEDADVHSMIGELYLKLGNEDRAHDHYEKMYELDSRSSVTKLKYVSYLLQYGDFDKAKVILDHIDDNAHMNKDQKSELLWFKSSYHYHKDEFEKSLEAINQVLKHDPWNIAYLVQQALVLSSLNQDKVSFSLLDSVLKNLSRNIEDDLDWDEFDIKTRMISQSNLLELDYCRTKLRFLYDNDHEDHLVALLTSACKLDAGKCTHDFLKLLNTNFDSPNIYWALGRLYKELWQLEGSCIWFEQILLSSDSNETHKAKAYQELADCYNWRGDLSDKAVEYGKIALDLAHDERDHIMRTLAHSLLIKGEVRQAQVYLEELDSADPEVVYLLGLLNYRNGLHKQANEVWKPLLTLRSDSLRIHNIKQQVMKYYFDKEPYQTIN